MSNDVKFPIRLHKSQLPVRNISGADKDGFLHGYFLFSETDKTAVFMGENGIIFKCSRPFITAQTHLLARYSVVIYTGYDKSGNLVGKLCDLTIFYN